MTLNDALKIPGVWWVLKDNLMYRRGAQPHKVEVIKVLDGQSLVRINNTEVTSFIHQFDYWVAYDNFWLAWAAMQRSSRK